MGRLNKNRMFVCLCDSDATAAAGGLYGNCASVHVQFTSDSAAEILVAPIIIILAGHYNDVNAELIVSARVITCDKCRHFLYFCWQYFIFCFTRWKAEAAGY